ncbi:glycosyltransferase family 4 protein [Oceanobacillus manasiensis]|uniref:glycosyltransferase family 4 protein n=1 Tax=Oceanobacillus manasiensis TaxID=586413 RepID=UPI0005A9031E|nr:glycosyltransferase family 1 protein [Oceanobacillus manasiensis]
MRIAIFTDTYAPEINGVALTLRRYTDYLEKQGIEYRLFAPTVNKQPSSFPQVERLNSIPFLLYRDLRFAIPNTTQIKQILDTFQPTLIHIATPFNVGLYGLHYGKKHNIPMIASYHTHFDNYLDYYSLSFLKKWLWKYMYWFHSPFEKVYVPTTTTRDKLLAKQLHPDISVWGRGVDRHVFSPKKRMKDFFKDHYGIQAKKIILYVGRMSPEKDIDIVLESYYSLAEHVREDTHLVMVGDGPLYRTLSQQHQENITWTGFLEGEQLARVYASSDVFLFPSPTETFGNVVLEALASGLPVIGANAGGVKNLVENEKRGFLCEQKNSKAFAQKTTLLLENQSLRNSFSSEARLFAETLSWNEIFGQFVGSFYEVLKRKKLNSAIA